MYVPLAPPKISDLITSDYWIKYICTWAHSTNSIKLSSIIYIQFTAVTQYTPIEYMLHTLERELCLVWWHGMIFSLTSRSSMVQMCQVWIKKRKIMKENIIYIQSDNFSICEQQSQWWDMVRCVCTERQRKIRQNLNEWPFIYFVYAMWWVKLLCSCSIMSSFSSLIEYHFCIFSSKWYLTQKFVCVHAVFFHHYVKPSDQIVWLRAKTYYLNELNIHWILSTTNSLPIVQSIGSRVRMCLYV